MASCLPFTSCFAGWFAKSDANAQRQYSASRVANSKPKPNKNGECACGGFHQGRFGRLSAVPPKPDRLGQTPTGSVNCFQWRRKRKAGPLPEPCTIAQLPTGVLKHWAPQSRCCEEVMEEIRLNSMGEAKQNVPPEQEEPPATQDNERRKILDRFWSLFVKQKTPAELEMEALRKERKAVVKYLKWVGLYDRRMTYEHMKTLKTVTEESLESERQKVEIELKELERQKDESNSKTVCESTEQPAAPADVPQPTTTPKVESATISQVKSDQFEVRRLEGPMEATDGTVIHPGTGLPVSAAIDCPGTVWPLPMPMIPVIKDNMLLNIVPGDVPCAQCNPEVIVVQAEIHPEPRMDEEMDQGEGVKQPVSEMAANEARPPPLPVKTKPRVVGFVLKPGVTLEELDAIEVDPNYDPQEQNKAKPMGPFTDDFTPKPLQNLRWTFGHPFGYP